MPNQIEGCLVQSFYTSKTNIRRLGGIYRGYRCARCTVRGSGIDQGGGNVHILVINSGSSSIKFSLFDSRTGEPRSLFEGEVTGIGGEKAGFKFRDANGRDLSKGRKEVEADTSVEAIGLVAEAVSDQGLPKIEAVGYRVVHPGAKLDRHQRISP